MSGKVIAIEESEGPFKLVFQRVMRMVPDRDRNDKNLQRLIAFRLKNDGEAATTGYLIQKIRELVRCAYRGNFYDFIKDDAKEKECGFQPPPPEPPDVA
ncbi:MAG: hypothetical protein GY859_43195 [Desulfobacterales bacterium]|nr:hypothetical protein [Desulfobacterales bacterium]